MADSAVVGILRVLLTANAAEFETTMKKAGDTTKTLSGDLAKTSTAAQNAGRLLTNVMAGLGATLSVGAVVAFGKQLLDAADATVKLADKTGIAIEPLQKLQFIAEQSGNSIDQVANAVSMLQRRLAGGEDSAVNALTSLGIELQSFKALNPDQQFMAIAREVGKIEDPMERARVATELFGRAGAELLPTLIANVDDLANKAPVMSEKATKAFDAIGDAISRVWTTSRNLIGEGIGGMIDGYGRLAQAATALVTGDFGKVPMILADVADVALPKLPPKLDALIPPVKGVSMSMEEMDKVSKELTKSVEKKAAALEKARKPLEQLTASFMIGRLAIEPYTAALSDSSAMIAEVREEMELLGSQSLPEAAAATEEAERAVRDWARANGAVLAPSIKAVGTALEETTKKAGLFSGVLDDLGATIVRAFEGGGDVLKSIGSTIGKRIGDNFVTEFGATIKGKLGDVFGDLLNSVIPGIGALLGPLLSKVGGFFKNLFGIGANDEVKKYNAEIEKLRQSLLLQHGTLDKLEAKANALGLSFKAAWGHQNKAGLEAFTALIKEFEQRTEDATTALQAAGAELAELQSEGQITFEKMREAAEKYGVDLAALGPKFQSGRLHDAAMQIWNDFILLTRGGADVGGVLLGMQDEIQNLVNDSLAFGIAIPENFRPLLQNLLEAGKLTDANGEKLTDLSQLQFGDPIVARLDAIAESMKTIADRIAELVAKITGPLMGAINAVPTTVPINFVGTFTPPDIAVPGGLDVPHLAAGGIVTAPTLAMIGEHGPEAVVPLSGAHGLGVNEDSLARKIGVALRDVGGAVKVFLAVDPRSGRLRILGDNERAQIQEWADLGQLTFPARAIRGR